MAIPITVRGANAVASNFFLVILAADVVVIVVLLISVVVALLADETVVLFYVICRVWRRSKDKDVKFEQQQEKINSVIPAITPTTFSQRPTENPQYII